MSYFISVILQIISSTRPSGQSADFCSLFFLLLFFFVFFLIWFDVENCAIRMQSSKWISVLLLTLKITTLVTWNICHNNSSTSSSSQPSSSSFYEEQFSFKKFIRNRTIFVWNWMVTSKRSIPALMIQTIWFHLISITKSSQFSTHRHLHIAPESHGYIQPNNVCAVFPVCTHFMQYHHEQAKKIRWDIMVEI